LLIAIVSLIIYAIYQDNSTRQKWQQEADSKLQLDRTVAAIKKASEDAAIAQRLAEQVATEAERVRVELADTDHLMRIAYMCAVRGDYHEANVAIDEIVAHIDSVSPPISLLDDRKRRATRYRHEFETRQQTYAIRLNNAQQWRTSEIVRQQRIIDDMVVAIDDRILQVTDKDVRRIFVREGGNPVSKFGRIELEERMAQLRARQEQILREKTQREINKQRKIDELKQFSGADDNRLVNLHAEVLLAEAMAKREQARREQLRQEEQRRQMTRQESSPPPTDFRISEPEIMKNPCRDCWGTGTVSATYSGSRFSKLLNSANIQVRCGSCGGKGER